MALPAPKLDDRTFQDIVSEARALIPRYCPEWTDHNLSDPGITLIELFASIVEILLYRLNKVPDKNYIKFMDLIGVEQTPASSAKANVTFRLSGPQQTPVTIPAGTEVASVRTETEEAIVFTTDADLTVQVPTLIHFLITRDGVRFIDFMDQLDSGKPIEVFKSEPQKDNAFYLGYREPLSGNVLSVTMDCALAKGTGVNPNDPPLTWEYWDGAVQEWQPFERSSEHFAWLESDGTAALNKRGEVVLHIPNSFAATQVGLRMAYWIRCRLISPKPGQPVYSASPAVLSVTSSCVGGEIPASHGVQVVGEQLGLSSGDPGQVFRLVNSPILALESSETVEVSTEEDGYEAWQKVSDFSQSRPDDRHFTCDTAQGEVRFGPGIRQPDGKVLQCGGIPPKGRKIRVSSYRYGGGSAGNVVRNTLAVPKSSIPYIASVTNRRAAIGGADQESLESAKLRAPLVFRARRRAVTEADFELFAMESSKQVARTKCVQPREVGAAGEPPPGVVLVLVIPRTATTEGRLTPEQLALPEELKEAVRSYLNERRLLSSFLVVSQPDLVWVSVEVTVRIKPKFNPAQMRAVIERELYRFLNPLSGGATGQGWPFGRDLIVSDVYSQIQKVNGVEYVEEARMYPVDAATGERGQAVQRLVVPRTGVICSHEHKTAINEGVEL